MLEGADKNTAARAGSRAAQEAHHLIERGILTMAEFNNTNLADFSGVWVFCEQRQGELQPTVLELMSEARKLADDMGVEVCGLLLGDKVEGNGQGARRIRRGQGLCLRRSQACDLHDRRIRKGHLRRRHGQEARDPAESRRPTSAATLGPRCAARLHTGPDRRLHPSGCRCRQVHRLPQGELHPA